MLMIRMAVFAIVAAALLASRDASAQAPPPSGVYIVDSRNDRIVRIDDMTGAGWTVLGTRGTGTNQFADPYGIAIDQAGRIYVTDTGNDRIVRVDDMSGAAWVTFGGRGAGMHQFSSPRGIAVDQTGRIYVVDGGNDRIVRFDDMTGAGWITLGSRGGQANQFLDPAGIALDQSGRIYIIDFGNSRLVRMDNLTGAGWFVQGPRIQVPIAQTFVGGPVGIAVDRAVRVHVTELRHSVSRFTLPNMFDLTGMGIRSPGNGVGQFASPTGVAVDAADRIYVADTDNRRVIRSDNMRAAGWVALGAEGRGTNQFDRPIGIAVR